MRTGTADDASAIRALVVDDDALLRSALARLLKQRGLEVQTASNGCEALELLEREPFDVVLSDALMPEMSGLALLESIRANNILTEVIVMTARATETMSAQAAKAGAYSFITKPFRSNEELIVSTLNAAHHLRLRRTSAESRELARSGMLGTCTAMRDVQRLIEGVAPTSSTVLVLGESGTGKELVARAIHQRSRRAHKPLVTVNCGAIAKDLVESELFGHKRGAFTTAHAARAGLFEAADGGTIFLDEIGELPLRTQVTLLRTLQSGEVKAVGSDETSTVDVRVIAATNSDLKAEIARGNFRSDLYYRLNVITISIPPLRDRGDDVLLLAHHFLQMHAAATGRSVKRVSDEAALLLERYDWPGNVRELEHAIERAVVLARTETLDPESLPVEIVTGVESSERTRASRLPPPPLSTAHVHTVADLVRVSGLDKLPYAEAKKRLLAEFSDAYAAATLRAAGGNVSEAARLSGLDRSNYRRLVRSLSSRDKPPPRDDD
ncbi:MAG: sigma-54-dependent Fis family transcriptional regulator [Labilithrix sp.]|nr:sigma-54-dependent Fis family transcriptional regulator [Labilithrix sp.]